MGNTGLRKLISPLDYVETKYACYSDIDLLTLDKQIVRIQPYKQAIFLHFRTSLPPPILHRLLRLDTPHTKVVLLPDSQTPHNFQQINLRYPQSYAKISLNGDTMHPLVKYLKRNCSTFYDSLAMGAKPIGDTIGAFVVVKNPQEGSMQVVRYYREGELQEFLASLSQRET